MDGELIGQALLNPFANAAEAALAGSNDRPKVLLSGFLSDERVAFRVSDNGAGVPHGKEETIFQPFFSLKSGGSGIGLGLARQIAAGHGGGLRLDAPAAGGGASFVLSL